MYSTTDIGNICLICLLLFAFLGFMGLEGAGAMVMALGFIVFVAIMLHK